jgi:membrane protease YdiL (CAAX protease family)
MAVPTKTFPAGPITVPPAFKGRSVAVPAAHRRVLVWAQIVVAFLFLEFALWEPRLETRNRWIGVAAITILVLALIDRTSLERLGLRLPKTFGASVVLGISFATAVFLVAMVHWAGGQVPANPTWPRLYLMWQYFVWAMIQQFILQSFFFTRCEELFGSSAAVWVTATLFASAHLPSPILTTFTLVGGLFFCEMFRRYRSIYPIGIVHAVLGLTIAVTMPDSLLHHMRVGIGYLRY